MKTYEQTVTFTKKIKVVAKNAEGANQKFEEECEEAAMYGDMEGYERREVDDEPIECPHCHGEGIEMDDDDDLPCGRCDGVGEIYPKEYHDDASNYR